MPRVRSTARMESVYASYTTCMAGSRQAMATRHSVLVLLKDLHQHLSHPQPGSAGHLSPPEDLHNQTSVQWQSLRDESAGAVDGHLEKIHNLNVFHEQKVSKTCSRARMCI